MIDEFDIITETSELEGWNKPIPRAPKQALTCVSCGGDAVFCNGQIHCTELCHHFACYQQQSTTTGEQNNGFA